MRNIVPTWKNKASSLLEEQAIASSSPIGEAELTDEQLEAIHGGQKRGDDEHHDHDGWDNHDHDKWGHHDGHDGWNNYDRDGWYYYGHHWWHHPHYTTNHHGH